MKWLIQLLKRYWRGATANSFPLKTWGLLGKKGKYYGHD